MVARKQNGIEGFGNKIYPSKAGPNSYFLQIASTSSDIIQLQIYQ